MMTNIQMHLCNENVVNEDIYIKMIEYFQILEQNSLILYGVNTNPDCIQKPCYNLFSSRVQMFHVNQQYPWDVENINRNSEVLVRVNILTPNFFVKDLKF